MEIMASLRSFSWKEIKFEGTIRTKYVAPWRALIEDGWKPERGNEGEKSREGRGHDDFIPGEVTKTAPSGDETT